MDAPAKERTRSRPPRRESARSTGSPRLFDSDIFEFFSKVHVSVPIVLYGGLITYFFYRASTDPAAVLWLGVASCLLGIFLWTIVEYLVHRFVFHHEPRSALGRKLHFICHGVHHDHPNDRLRLVMPPAITIPVTIVLYSSFGLFLPDFVLHTMGIGFAASYLAYDLMHYAIHHLKIDHPLWARVRTYHLQHHFADSGTKFGVTSPLWDRIFGTR